MLLFISQSYRRSRERKGKEKKTNSHLVSSIVANFVAHFKSVAANVVCIGEYLRPRWINMKTVLQHPSS